MKNQQKLLSVAIATVLSTASASAFSQVAHLVDGNNSSSSAPSPSITLGAGDTVIVASDGFLGADGNLVSIYGPPNTPNFSIGPITLTGSVAGQTNTLYVDVASLLVNAASPIPYTHVGNVGSLTVAAGSGIGNITDTYPYDDVGLQVDGDIDNLTNNGAILGNDRGMWMFANQGGRVSMTNSATGTISGTGGTGGSQFGIYLVQSPASAGLLELNNAGTITGATTGIETNGYEGNTPTPSISELVNSGTITGTTAHGIYLDGAEGQSYATSITNTATGVISGGMSGIAMDDTFDGTSDNNDAYIGILTNLGTIQGGSAEDISLAEANNNIGTLNNAQGGADALTYAGPLPTNYHIVINSAIDYGILDVSPGYTGQITFGVEETLSSGIVGNTVYPGVFVGLKLPDDFTATSGTSGSTDWALSINPNDPTKIDLCVGDCTSAPPIPVPVLPVWALGLLSGLLGLFGMRKLNRTG